MRGYAPGLGAQLRRGESFQVQFMATEITIENPQQDRFIPSKSTGRLVPTIYPVLRTDDMLGLNLKAAPPVEKRAGDYTADLVSLLLSQSQGNAAARADATAALEAAAGAYGRAFASARSQAHQRTDAAAYSCNPPTTRPATCKGKVKLC